MTNYNGVEQDIVKLHNELKEIVSELDAVYNVFTTGWELTGRHGVDLVCGEMALAGYAEVSKKLIRLAKYNAGVVFYEKGDEK